MHKNSKFLLAAILLTNNLLFCAQPQPEPVHVTVNTSRSISFSTIWMSAMTGAIAYLWWSSKNAVTNASLNQELKKTEEQLTTEINKNGQEMLGEISKLKKFTCKASVLCLIQGASLYRKIDKLENTTRDGFIETKEALDSLKNKFDESSASLHASIKKLEENGAAALDKTKKEIIAALNPEKRAALPSLTGGSSSLYVSTALQVSNGNLYPLLSKSTSNS